MRFKSTYFGNIHKQVIQQDGKTVIKGVVIVQAGVDKCGDLIDEDFLRELSVQGNAKDGVKCRFGHPTMCKESLGTYLGKYRNFSVVNDGGTMKVIADLELDEVAKETPQGNLFDYVVKMATQNPDTFGNSIVCMADSEPADVDGRQVQRLIMKKFLESDLVDSPAATDNLFKSSEDVGVMLTHFLDENPQVFDMIAKDHSAVEIFFKKYINYANQRNKNIDMSLMRDIMAAIGLVKKDIDITTADGSILTVVTDANNPQVGDKVNIGEATAADGEYLLPDGGAIVVAGGVISEIKEAPAADEPEEAKPAAPSGEEVAKAVSEGIEKMTNELSQTMKSTIESLEQRFQKDIAELRDGLMFIAKHTGSTYVPPVEKQEGHENDTPPAAPNRTPLSELK